MMKRVTVSKCIYPAMKEYDWLDGKRQWSFCGKGLEKFIHVPKKAKKLHIAGSLQKPKALSNVIRVDVDNNYIPTSQRAFYYVDGKEWKEYMPWDIREFLSSVLRNRSSGTVWVSFEWS